MLRNESNGATGHRRSLRFVPAVMLPVLLILAALVPASAMAGGGSGSGGGSEDACTAEVRATDEQTGARITVECGEGATIDDVELSLNELNEGRVEGESGTRCEPEDTSLNFTCETSGSNDGSGIAARFTDDDGESVCADPALEIDFTVNFFGERSSEEIENVQVSGCSGTSGAGGGGGDEDDGATPEGGVDSGAGGTVRPSGPVAAGLPLTGAALTVLALGSAGVVIRKTRTTP